MQENLAALGFVEGMQCLENRMCYTVWSTSTVFSARFVRALALILEARHFVKVDAMQFVVKSLAKSTGCSDVLYYQQYWGL